MNVLVIEDEISARNHLKRILLEIDAKINVLGEISTVSSAIKYFKESNEMLDLIFLDIHLSDGIAFDIFEDVDIQTPIVFTTAYDQYAIEAFDYYGIAYILKPITLEKLKQAICKFKKLQLISGQEINRQLYSILNTMNEGSRQSRKRFLVKLGNKFTSIPTNEISYFFRQDYTYLMTKNGKKYPVEYSLDIIEKQLDSTEFVRINRQVLTRIDSIITLEQFFAGKLLAHLLPKPPIDIVVSQKKASWLREILNS